MAGRHDVRVGGEYLKYLMWHDWCNFLRGNLIADNGPVPANIEQLFPVWNDPSTWNIAALSPISREYRTSFGSCNIQSPARHLCRLVPGRLAPDIAPDAEPRRALRRRDRYLCERPGGASRSCRPIGPLDTDNVVPRVGFAYSLNDRTVIRGGAGKYYAWLINQVAHPIRFANVQRVLSTLYDGRADFAVNPWNGPLPRAEDLEQVFCNVNFVPGCIRRALGQTIAPPDARERPTAIRHRLACSGSSATRWVSTSTIPSPGSARTAWSNYNINLSFNPATGLNYPFTDISRRPYHDWAAGTDGHLRRPQQLPRPARSSLTKRLSNSWQGSATYTLSALRDGIPNPWSGVMNPVPFTVQATARSGIRIGGHRPAAPSGVQRHLADGLWVPVERPVLLRIGAALRHHLRRRRAGTGGTVGSDSGAPGERRGRRDARETESRGSRSIESTCDSRSGLHCSGARGSTASRKCSTLFNHANYGSYTTVESNRNYGHAVVQPECCVSAAYAAVGFPVYLLGEVERMNGSARSWRSAAEQRTRDEHTTLAPMLRGADVGCHLLPCRAAKRVNAVRSRHWDRKQRSYQSRRGVVLPALFAVPHGTHRQGRRVSTDGSWSERSAQGCFT